MRRIIVIVALLAVVGIGGFLYLFKREAVRGLYESTRGYPEAKTPQEAVDLFKKAVAARRYDMAAKYCTKEYAEQLKKAAEAGKDMGTAIDDLTHRMKNDNVMTGEIEYILWLNDPMPKNFQVTLQTTGEKESTASLYAEAPKVQDATKTWKFDRQFVQAFYVDQATSVKVVKEGSAWKLDFPVTPAVRNRIDRFIANHKDYVNALNKMSEEVRTERTTKLDVLTRLEELLNEAVTAPK